MLKCVILAGGTGSRLWPLSRNQFPKQFISFDGKETLLQSTANRLSEISDDEITIVTNKDQSFFVADQLNEINKSSKIIIEPIQRNTAPAISLALLDLDEDDLVLISPSDHIIENKDQFVKTIMKANEVALNNKLVTFGIEPHSPHTGYGYIKRGKDLGNTGYEVEKFIEKPSLNKAEKYLKSDDFLWNSGIFLFQVKTLMKEIEKYSPDIYNLFQSSKLIKDSRTGFYSISEDHFSLFPEISIDHAIMEKSSRCAVVPMKNGWHDLGSWSSLWDIEQKDKDGNVCKGDILLEDSSNNFILSEGSLITTLGVENLVIVSTKDAMFVGKKEKSEDIKILIDKLKKKSRQEVEYHTKVYRPWGNFSSIERGEGFQVKKLVVNPGEKISLQKHKHRSEHWVVVSGRAEVTNGDDTFVLEENESTYIPAGRVHSLGNPGKTDLEIIEVQTGSYLGEDDIIRLEDRYGRVEN